MAKLTNQESLTEKMKLSFMPSQITSTKIRFVSHYK